MEIVHHLASVPLFKGLPSKQIESLAMILVDQTLSRGKNVFIEGDEGAGFYIVISGRVKIYKLSSEGKEQILHIFGPGEPFGEVPVFAGQHFPANAATMEESRLFFFSRDAFINLIRKNPDLALNMLAVLSRRLRKFTRLVEDLSLKEVPGRLAAYLLYLRDQNNGASQFKLDISKNQLASVLGTIPETLSRILGRMSKGALIATEGPRIRILDLEGLEDLAEGGGHL
jgi:CRP/FNR family transcriptional regulator